jgi:hypothetical protein
VYAHFDFPEEGFHLLKAMLEVAGKPVLGEDSEEFMRKMVSAYFEALEGGQVRLVNSTIFFEPIKTRIDRAAVPAKDIGLIFRIEDFPSLVETVREEIADTVNNRVLEHLEGSNVDGRT